MRIPQRRAFDLDFLGVPLWPLYYYVLKSSQAAMSFSPP
jgi:hypothetical protein